VAACTSRSSGARCLTKEILQRLQIPFVEAADVETAEDVNAEVTKSYQTV
jgi:hypothetical protein